MIWFLIMKNLIRSIKLASYLVQPMDFTKDKLTKMGKNKGLEDLCRLKVDCMKVSFFLMCFMVMGDIYFQMVTYILVSLPMAD